MIAQQCHKTTHLQVLLDVNLILGNGKNKRALTLTGHQYGPMQAIEMPVFCLCQSVRICRGKKNINNTSYADRCSKTQIYQHLLHMKKFLHCQLLTFLGILLVEDILDCVLLSMKSLPSLKYLYYNFMWDLFN